jgi:EmrB/QacA subfamily drug resistance transporter
MTQTSDRASQTEAAPPRTGTMLAIILTGVFMAILDVAIVNVAAPTIGKVMGATGAQLQLVVAGYIIAYAVLLITGARLGDLLGRKRMFLAGMLIFTVASLLCGVAWSTVALILFRLVQGVGAALIVPQVLSLIQLNFEGLQRARALGLYAAVIAGGAIAGQVLGGVLVAANLFDTQWRLVFLINVPIGLLALLAGVRRLPDDEGHPGRKLDLPGVLVLSVAVLALVLPLTLGHQLGWPAWTWISLAGAAVLAIVFVFVERATGRGGGAPLVSGPLLRAPGMVVGVVAILAAMANYGGILFLLTLFVQQGLGHGPLVAGVVFLPSAVAFAITSLNWRKLPVTWHRRMVPLALLVAALSFVGLALSMRTGHITVGMELSIMFFGTGMGLAFSPLFAFALAHVPPVNAADASGVLSTVNQLGQVIGVAAYGTIFLSLFHVQADAPHAAMVTAFVMAIGGAVAAVTTLALPPAKQ